MLISFLDAPQPFLNEAITDVLKVCFNLVVHFRRASTALDFPMPHPAEQPSSDATMLGDLWTPDFDP